MTIDPLALRLGLMIDPLGLRLGLTIDQLALGVRFNDSVSVRVRGRILQLII